MDLLVLNQGPLGFVWLAANYDKKLTKQQLLSASIIKSSQLITNQPISFSLTTKGDNGITLRLSGQLLLGIVRIYSRKTKYLLDDVNDILLRLKTSFKHASGVNLGSDAANTLNLEVQDSVIKNIKTITLQDQVTKFDLLYQDDLNLDDEAPQSRGIFGQSQGTGGSEDSLEDSFDDSIEFGRFDDAFDAATPGNDLGLELDFDLDESSGDESIEVGRDASHASVDQEMSVLEGISKNDVFNLEPLERITEVETTACPEPRVPRHRQRRNRITEEGEIIMVKRKLVVDSDADLEGLLIQVLKDNQNRVVNAQGTTHTLTDTDKLNDIFVSSAPIASKRRKLWNIDNHYEDLHRKCIEVARRDRQAQEEQHNLQFEDDSLSDGLDFDISLPEFGDDELSERNEESEHESFEDSQDTATHSTTQVALQLRDIFAHKPTTDLAELMEKDLHIHSENEEEFPLGYNRASSKVSTRKEATKCFFELLVLATNDCVELKQEQSTTEIGTNVDITTRDSIFGAFL